MLLRAPLALAIAIACSCTSVPTPPPAVYAAAERAPLDADAATRFLIDASVFEDVAISIDGHESDGARAWRVVFADEDAAGRFRRVAVEGGLVGKLYAAIGLRQHDPAAYDVLVTALAKDPSRVETHFGCMTGSLPVADLIESKAANAVRLNAGEDLDDWFANHGGSGDLDIVGGGYTAWFAQH